MLTKIRYAGTWDEVSDLRVCRLSGDERDKIRDLPSCPPQFRLLPYP